MDHPVDLRQIAPFCPFNFRLQVVDGDVVAVPVGHVAEDLIRDLASWHGEDVGVLMIGASVYGQSIFDPSMHRAKVKTEVSLMLLLVFCCWWMWAKEFDLRQAKAKAAVRKG